MDDSVQVCNCNGVSKGDLVACVRGGEHSVTGCMNATRAGKGCGACKPLVRDIVEWAVTESGGEVGEDQSANWYVPAIPMDKPTLIAAIKEQNLRSVSAVLAALAPDGEDAGSKMPLTSLLRVVWNGEFVNENDARFINDRVHANIQRDGTFSVVPQIKGGITTAGELRRIADVADKYEIPMIKITGGQRIDLLGVRKEDLPGVWADLDMPSGYAYGKSFRTVKSCVGTDYCRFGLGDSTTLAVRLEQTYQGLESPAKMKLAVAGCPRNCSEALVKDVGVVAVGDDRWDVLIGGAAGASVRRGDVLATVDGHDEVIRLAGVFMQYYRENAQAGWSARTTSCRGWGSTSSRRSWSTTATGSSPAWRSGCRRRSTPTATRGRTGANRRARASSRTTCRCSRCRSCRSAGLPTGACRRRRRVAARRRADRSRAEREPCPTTKGRRHDHVRDHGTCGRSERRAAARRRARLRGRRHGWWRCSGCGPGSCGRSTRSARTRAARWRTGSSTRRR